VAKVAPVFASTCFESMKHLVQTPANQKNKRKEKKGKNNKFGSISNAKRIHRKLSS
jgi:hypothetical protein